MGTFGHIRTMLAAAGLAISIACTASGAAALMLTSSVSQSGHAGASGLYPLTGTSPYDYSGQSYLALTDIDSLSITLTIKDGDSAAGDFDLNNLVLELDGITTGITLNGFRNNAIDTLTITGTPSHASALLAALQVDGILVGQVKSLSNSGNWLSFPAAYHTTLHLEGPTLPTPTPEPATLSLLGLGLAGLVLYRRRQA